MLNHKNTKKMETKVIIEKNKELEKKREETQKKIFIYNKACIIENAIKTIINASKYGGKYDRNTINDALCKITDECYNIQYYNNI